MRGGAARGHGHAAGALPHVPAARGGCTSPRRGARTATARGVVKSARGHMVFSKPCAHCGGTGRQRQTRCPACGGQQVEMRTESLTIDAAARPGRRRADPRAGQGARRAATAARTATSTSPSACSRIRCSEREGDDLHLTVPIAIHEAALGAKIEVPSLDGPARAARAAGHAVGSAVPRCASAASPSPRDGRRGDLVVEVRLVLPKLLDERSKELLREFGRINGAEDVRRHRRART